eukprot:gene8563-10164_t
MSNEADVSAFDGVPLYMRRKARIMTSGDRNAMLAFVRANADQPTEFWFTESQVEDIRRSRSSEMRASLPRRSAHAATPRIPSHVEASGSANEGPRTDREAQISEETPGERLQRTRSAHVGALQSLEAPSDGRGHGLRSHGVQLCRTSSQRIAELTANTGAGLALERAATAPADLRLALDAPQAPTVPPRALPVSPSHSAAQVPSAEALRTAVMDSLRERARGLWDAADTQWRRLGKELEEGKESRWAAGVGKRDMCEVHLPRFLLRNDARVAWEPPYAVRPTPCQPEAPATGGTEHPWPVGTRVLVPAPITDPLNPSSRNKIDAGSTATVLAHHRTDAGVHEYLVEEEALGVRCWGRAVEDAGRGTGRGRPELVRLAEACGLELQVGGLVDARVDGALEPFFAQAVDPGTCASASQPDAEPAAVQQKVSADTRPEEQGFGHARVELGGEVWVSAQIVEVMHDESEEQVHGDANDGAVKGGKGDANGGAAKGAKGAGRRPGKGGKGAGRRPGKGGKGAFGFAPGPDEAADRPSRRGKPSRIRVIFNNASLPAGLRDAFPRFEGGPPAQRGRSGDGGDGSVRTCILHLQPTAATTAASSTVPAPCVQPLGTHTAATTATGDKEGAGVQCGVCHEPVWEAAHPSLPFTPAVPCGSCSRRMHHRCACAVREALEQQPSGADGPGITPSGSFQRSPSGKPEGKNVTEASSVAPNWFCFACAEGSLPEVWVHASLASREGGEGEEDARTRVGISRRGVQRRGTGGRGPRRGLLSSSGDEKESVPCGDEAVLRDVKVVVVPDDTPARFASVLQALAKPDEEEGAGGDAVNNPFGLPAFGVNNPFWQPAIGGRVAAFGRGAMRAPRMPDPAPATMAEVLPQPNPFGGPELGPEAITMKGRGRNGVKLCVSGDAASMVRAPLQRLHWTDALTPDMEVEVKACFTRHYRYGGKEYLATDKAEWRWVRGIILQRASWLHGELAHLLAVDFQVEHEVSLGSMPSHCPELEDFGGPPPNMTTLFVANIGGAFQDRRALEAALEGALTRVATEVVSQMTPLREPDTLARCPVEVLGADWHPGRCSATVCVTYEPPEGLNAPHVYEQVARRLHGVEVRELMKYVPSLLKACPECSVLMKYAPSSLEQCADCRAWAPRVADGQRLVLALAADVECFIKAAEYRVPAADAAAASTSEQRRVHRLVATSVKQDFRMQLNPVVQVEGFERPCMLILTSALWTWLSRAADAAVAAATPELLIGQAVIVPRDLFRQSVFAPRRFAAGPDDPEDEAHLKIVGSSFKHEPQVGFGEVIGHLACTGDHLVDVSRSTWFSGAEVDAMRQIRPGDFLLADGGARLCLHPSVATQTRELEALVPGSEYLRLLERLREAEQQSDAEDGGMLLAVPRGMVVKLCPRCSARIEKNEGCDHMQCFRCGNHFSWGDAKELTDRPLAARATKPSSGAPEGGALLKAVRSGDAAATKDLLDRGANPNAAAEQDPEGRTPLHWAALEGFAAIVELLLAKGADLHIRDRFGDPALTCAIKEDHAATVETLLKAGAQVNGDRGDFAKPLNWAARFASVAVLEALVQAGAVLQVHDEDGATPLHSAVFAGSVPNTKFLLEAGAEVDAIHLGHQYTPLLEVIRHHHLQQGPGVLEALLGAGADINLESGSNTPLRLAIRRGCVWIVESLLQHGARVDANGPNDDDDDDAPLPFGAIGRHRVRNRKTLLHEALLAPMEDGVRVTMMEALIKAGADVNELSQHARGGGQMSPLHFAAENGFLHTTAALIQAGADVNYRDALGGTTVLKVASSDEIKEILLARGALAK